MKHIAIARSDKEIWECYEVMAELRSHIKPEEFLPLVRRLADISGFQLAFLSDEGIKAVAGFRISEWLATGTYLEIEDLVSKSGERSQGYGGELFDWLVSHAREFNCSTVRLVSHVSREDAHRFYEAKGMTRVAHYFSLTVA
jgi:GNAT superfamily N-acetyltransferase